MRILPLVFFLFTSMLFAQPSYFYDTETRKHHVRFIWKKDAAADGTGAAGYDIQYKKCDTCTWTTPSQAAPPSAGTDVTLYFTGDTTAVAYNIPENAIRWFRIRTITGSGPTTYSDWLNTDSEAELDTNPGPLIVSTGLRPARIVGHRNTDTYSYTAPDYSAETTNEFGLKVNSITNRDSQDVAGNTFGYPTNPMWHIGADSTVVKYFTRPEANGDQDINPSTWALTSAEDKDRIVSPAINDTLFSYKGDNGSRNSLIETEDGSASTLATFSSYRSDQGVTIPTAESKVSADGKYIALEVYQTGQTDPSCMIYNIHTETVESVASPGFDLGGGWFGVSQSGRWVVWISSPTSPDGRNLYVRHNDATQTDSGLGNLWTSLGSVGHADLVTTVQGHDAILGRHVPNGSGVRNSATVLIPLEGPKQGEIINLHWDSDVRPELAHVSGDNPFNPGWATVDSDTGSGSGSPTGNIAYTFHKIWTVHLNEYVVESGQDAYVRYYARAMWNGAKTVDQHPYSRTSPDGLIMFYNQDFPTSANSFNWGTAWRSVQEDDIGDEIPYNEGSSDVTAPTVTAIDAEDIVSNLAYIEWSLDEGGTGQVEYGLTDSYGSTTTEETSFLTFHRQALTGLSDGTTYHYRVVGEDASANEYASSDNTFTTSSTGKVIVIGTAGSTRDHTGKVGIIVN